MRALAPSAWPPTQRAHVATPRATSGAMVRETVPAIVRETLAPTQRMRLVMVRATLCETVPVTVREKRATLAASRSAPPGRTHLATIRATSGATVHETGRVIVRKTVGTLAPSGSAPTPGMRLATLRATMCETIPAIVRETLAASRSARTGRTRLATRRATVRATSGAMVRETSDATMYATLRVIAWETLLLAVRAALRLTVREIVRETHESLRSGDCWRLCAKVRLLPACARRSCGGCGNMRSAIRNMNSYFGRSRRYLLLMLRSCARHWGCGSRVQAFLNLIWNRFSMPCLRMPLRLRKSCANSIPFDIWLIREAA